MNLSALVAIIERLIAVLPAGASQALKDMAEEKAKELAGTVLDMVEDWLDKRDLVADGTETPLDDRAYQYMESQLNKIRDRYGIEDKSADGDDDGTDGVADTVAEPNPTPIE
jgi:hypothetical protein